MKKLGLMVLVAGIVLMAGCAGDDPAGPSGTLADVTNLAIDESASEGRDVVLTWDAVDDVDGYYVYFRATASAEWTQADDVTGTTYTHTADNSGYYTVKAYKGTNTSANNSNIVDTMPIQINETYTIWDNHAPETEHSGFIFGANSGTTGLASSTSFDQDIYCYDGSWTESPCGFYSGDVSPFGNGSHTDMISAGSTYGYPTGTSWWTTGWIVGGDIIFGELSDGHYVKAYVQSVPQHPTQPAAYGIVFYYDYQPIEGLYLFTNESS